MALLEVEDLTVTYPAGGRGRRHVAVDRVNLRVERGEAVGLVGESGSGKTTLGSAMVRLVPIAGGCVRFDGQDVGGLAGPALKRYRARVQMVFQDPLGALNPRLSVGAAIGEVLYVHGKARRAIPERVCAVLAEVGLDPSLGDRYPHELSGGQRQRVGIARALALEPETVIADEPVSALDVSVQVQIMNLLKDIQARLGLSLLLVAHDLAVVRYLCTRVYVMYAGQVVESGPCDELFRAPAHPYTEALLAAVPDVARSLGAGARRCRAAPAGADAASAGCPFHLRCGRAGAACRELRPPLRPGGSGRAVACHAWAAAG